jgi:hypothetical protein
MDMLGITVPNRLLVGQSVFDTKVEGRIYNQTDTDYWYLDPHVYIIFDEHGVKDSQRVTGPLRFAPIPPGAPEVIEGTTNLKSVLHYINEGLVNNRLYTWKESL